MSNANVSFYAEVGVSQSIDIVKEDVTPEELVEGLTSGKYLTTISYDNTGEKQNSEVIQFDTEGNEVVIGTIMSQSVSEDCATYRDFTLDAE